MRGRLVLAASIVAALLALLLVQPVHAPGTQRVASRPQVDNRNQIYVLDGWGGVHPVGSAPQLAITASWPHRDEAQSLALFPDGSGGYVMDANGDLIS